MSTLRPTSPYAPPSYASEDGVALPLPLRSVVTARLADYLELTKPRIAVMALVTVTVGYTLSNAGDWQPLPLLQALAGIALVAAGSSALNQYLERHTDARMERTARRPLPSGRLLPGEALCFGLATGFLGTLCLVLWVNLLTAGLALATLVLYVVIYTPLKRVTSFSTAVGAIPGALPPVLGWTAAGGALDARAFALFAILFLWQFPHFLAICWLYREDYARAGLRMLPAVRTRLHVAGYLGVIYALVLVPVSFLPGRVALAGDGYLFAAAVLGLGYAASAMRFLWMESRETARGLVWSSLVYLPLLLLSLTWNHLQLLQ